MDSNHERMPIAHNVRNVLNSFRTVATSLNHEIDYLDEKVEFDGLRELPLSLENENVRFKMWAGNLGAHQSGPASLDHRLREAPHIQEQVLYLLRDILESLEDIRVLMPRKEPPKDSADIEDKPEYLPASPDSEDSFTDSDLDKDERTPETRLSTLCTDIAEAIDCLLRLSLAIANPAPHERFRKLGAGPDEDISFYEAHDVRYVQDKFPNISQSLADILGKFITRRRQFFKYRESHHAKLAAGLDQETQRDTSRTEIVPNTVASSLPEHFKGSGVIDEDNRSDMAMSETSYATSAGYLMMENGEMKPAPPLKVPPRPPEADKGVFECPFCYRMISASSRGAWKRHVFGDLRPYTCLFSRCAESNTDFDRRRQWQLHVSQYHWRTWSCPFKCEGMFLSAVELGNHIRHQHIPSASDEHLATVVARGEVSVSNDVAQECPLCRRAISGLKSYVKHVGRHLEQLALHALPKIGGEELEDDIESDEQNDEASELGAVSAEESSDTSSKADEQLETGEIDNQVESSFPHATAVGYDAEGDVTAAGDTHIPPAASTISSDQPVVELAKMGKLEDIPLDIVMTQAGATLEEVGMMTTAEREAAAIEAVEKYKRQELARITAEKARIGMKEQEQLSIDPSAEAESASQDSRPVYTRMSRRHLSLETLREYDVNYEFDADPDYVLIRRWVPEWEQDRMWKHTRTIREKRAETLINETPTRSGEREYEWVRKKDRRRAKSPPQFHVQRDKGLNELLEDLKPVHNYNDTSGNQSSPPRKRNQSLPRLPSVGDRQHIHVRTNSRERDAPPAPSPPPPIHQGSRIAREVITQYREISHGVLPKNQDILCRNLLIYGHCRYEDQGCAFSHNQNIKDSERQDRQEREYKSDLQQ
ncbi:transcription factor Cys6 [Fusarium tjaetaba]|uniref:Transcription factor Cys6 n=1 Tax=Fusarium tjaetaba TaxID=1567544 RepID=A0A8H5QM33_9HYPO|nr:transcription factor Cys6 [Fusarium tjaetaba]KAF5616778.1 transcription factor Cys6 [Fusarium tjaetaba]